MKLTPQKLEGWGLSYDENFIILLSTVFVWFTRVTDRQTDGRAIAYSALSIQSYMLSRAKNHVLFQCGSNQQNAPLFRGSMQRYPMNHAWPQWRREGRQKVADFYCHCNIRPQAYSCWPDVSRQLQRWRGNHAASGCNDNVKGEHRRPVCERVSYDSRITNVKRNSSCYPGARWRIVKETEPLGEGATLKASPFNF